MSSRPSVSGFQSRVRSSRFRLSGAADGSESARAALKGASHARRAQRLMESRAAPTADTNDVPVVEIRWLQEAEVEPVRPSWHWQPQPFASCNCSPRTRADSRFDRDRAQQRFAAEMSELRESDCASMQRLRLSKQQSRAHRNPYAHLVADVDEFVRKRLARQVSFSERLELIDEWGNVVYISTASSDTKNGTESSRSEPISSEKLSTFCQRRDNEPTYLREIQAVGGEE